MKVLLSTITFIVLTIALAVLVAPKRMYHVTTLSDDQFCLYMDGPNAITSSGLKMGLLGCFDGTSYGDNTLNEELTSTQPTVIYVQIDGTNSPRVLAGR